MTDRFFDGQPCAHCGGTKRYVKGGLCVTCRQVYNRGLYEDAAEVMKAANRARYHANPQPHRDIMWAGSLKRKFGITRADYDAMLEKQDGRCAVCWNECATGRRLAVDHDHLTGRVRGLLCQACNTGVGKFRDSPELLKRAAEYLSGSVNAPTTSSVSSAFCANISYASSRKREGKLVIW